MIGLEIDDSFIKIVKAEFKDGAVKIEKGAIFKKGEFDEIEFRNELKGLIQKKERVVSTIPRGKISISYQTFPTQEPQEIREMAKYNALRQLPYSKGDIVFSYSILDAISKSSSRVMLVVGRRSLIEEYLLYLKANKIEPFVTINSVPLANILLKKLSPKQYLLTVDVDFNSTNICISGKGKLIFSREINKGIYDLLNKEAMLELWIDDIAMSISAYEKENLGPRIEKCFLSGVRIPHFIQQALGDKLKLEIEQVPLTEIVEMEPERIKTHPESLELNLFSFTKVAGLFTLEAVPEINLTPIEILRKKALEQKYKANLLLGTYLFISLLGFAGIIWWEFSCKNKYLRDLELAVKDLTKRIEILDRKKRIIELTLNRMKNESSFLNVLRDIASALPAGVNLRNLDYKGNKVVMDGVSSSLERIYDFSDRLRGSAIINSVEDLKVRESGKERQFFSLNLKLKSYETK